MTLSANDFGAFFSEVYGYLPFPWQERLLRQVAGADQGAWPKVLDLPTSSGKTAAIDIAVFHLALEADRGSARRAPVRIAFVVDRRLVVDDAFLRAAKLAKALCAPSGPVTARVAERLKGLAGEGPPLIARRLRGGIPRERDWARTPSQPTVLCSTVDQIGSRLLFRGYGVSDSMKPVDAGLIGADCLILLDEAHLAEPFRQTLAWVEMYKGPNWRENERAAPWGVALLTATPGEAPGDFGLNDDDRSNPTLKKRLSASKPARLVDMAKGKASAEGLVEAPDNDADTDEVETGRRTAVIAAQVQAAVQHSYGFGSDHKFPAVGVVVNRVARARAVFEVLRKTLGEEEANLILLIGPARPVDRDELADKELAPIRTGEARTLDKPLILVATQCIESGVDIDLDALITEAAPLDALRQRFGRLNRAGRAITPYAAVIAFKSDLGRNDPIYDSAIKASWERLVKASVKRGGEPTIDFGFNAFADAVAMTPDTLARKDDAPVLLPAHLDLLSQTAPIPAADPEVALYLHGAERQSDSITVVWRADIEPGMQEDENVRRLLTLVPPRSGEAIELPIWAVRRWLSGKGAQGSLADVAGASPEDEERGGVRGGKGRVFRWKGNTEQSRWIRSGELQPGDAIIVPASYGGVDEFGWNPMLHSEQAKDVARKAAEPFVRRSFAVRIAPGLLGETVSAEALADALAGAASQRWKDLRNALQTVALPSDIQAELARFEQAKGKTGRVDPYLDLYGEDEEGRPRGVVFVAPFGIDNEQSQTREEEGVTNSTEDDAAGSTPGYTLTLAEHSRDVEKKAGEFARAAGLSEDHVKDLEVAGFLHDAGKADLRFQAWLNYGDPLGPDLDSPEMILAKSARSLPRAARVASGLPERWRHEALSVRLAPLIGRFADADDPELVLWVLGTHHGYGRPLFPHSDPKDAETRAMPDVLGMPAELPPGSGPQSLAFDWNALDWPSLFVRLKQRYGVWELARMEAILRLADHRASEKRAAEAMS
ncbi:MAG: type I-U CRISPR-associated helicase/endonuclease Cas3 [Rhodospirillales bacterium]|nr:type I-U CRISPR-associated helicase/endonuclease Cas3 [Rhodospirillales bacterium]